jgi:predicted lysophospholipase L1 biosynthesis ABC-type transport system permease subunit
MAIGAAPALTIDGERVASYAVDDEVGVVAPTLLSGRRADAPGEMVVAPDLARIGDDLPVQFGGQEASLRVVGHVALPRADAMLTFEGLRQLAPDAAPQTALVDLHDDADVDAFLGRTVSTIGYTGQDVSTPDLPDDLVNFGRVDSAPVVVAVLMSLVAVATLVHALVTTVRRRNRELAVLRAIGLTRRQVLATVAWLAGVLVVVPVVVAVPIGVAAGRIGWNQFAHDLQVVARPIVPLLALVVAALGAVLLAEAVALLTGRWSARRAAAPALRSE